MIVYLLVSNFVQYIGQAAYISQNKGAFSNPFFNSVPPGMFYPSLVIAILAAIVASQTMITATFQVRIACPPLLGPLTHAASGVVVVPDNQTVILPANQSETHVESLPRSDIYSMGQLASHGRYYMRHSGIQQCKHLFLRQLPLTNPITQRS